MSAPTKRPTKPTAMTVAGIMSGTSADGIDIAIVRISPQRPRAASLSLELLAHRGFAFPALLRRAILAAQDAERISTAELARLNWRLGVAYAAAFRAMQASDVALIGCHGQTVYHQAALESYAGARFRCTWQIGEMAMLADAAGIPVVSNFRPADMVAGGQGAPLVPLLDQALYRDAKRTRVLQNIGGIGNLTIVPPRTSRAPSLAFDTGPGNMVMDALAQTLFEKPYDRGGRIAARGAVLLPVVREILSDPFFKQGPPRSAGREQFGQRFAKEFIRNCSRYSRAPEDAVSTAAALTAQSIANAVRRFVIRRNPSPEVDLIVSGGGAKNPTLLRMIDALLPEGVRLLDTADRSLPTPMPVDAKEAAAFALLAYMSWHRLPGNVPSATGATRPAVLGEVTCA